jgi:hypothetical protein
MQAIRLAGFDSVPFAKEPTPATVLAGPFTPWITEEANAS